MTINSKKIFFGQCIVAVVQMIGWLATVGCGSALGQRARDVTTYEDRCVDVKGEARPWLVGWDPADRVWLEKEAEEGILLVIYNGCELKVLTDCQVDGEYAFKEATAARDTLQIDTAEALYETAPLGASRISRHLRAGEEWQLDYVLVGTRSAVIARGKTSEMPKKCAVATHMVRAMAIGAYRLKAHTPPGNQADTYSTNNRQIIQDGDYNYCVQKGIKATDRHCQVPVQIYLDPIAIGKNTQGTFQLHFPTTHAETTADNQVLTESPGGKSAPADRLNPDVGSELFEILDEGTIHAALETVIQSAIDRVIKRAKEQPQGASKDDKSVASLDYLLGGNMAELAAGKGTGVPANVSPLRMDDADLELDESQPVSSRVQNEQETDRRNRPPADDSFILATDDEDITGVIKNRLKVIKSCYEIGLINDAELTGKIVVRFSLSATGEVVDVGYSLNELSNPVADCIVNVLRRTDFPSQKTVPANFEYPFFFSP